MENKEQEKREQRRQKILGLTLISGTSRGTIDHPNVDKLISCVEKEITQEVERETKELKQKVDSYENAFKYNDGLAEIKSLKEKIKELEGYIDKQIEHCNKMGKQNPTENYSKNHQMTKEQMSGYYQGRAEANYAIKDLLTNLNK